jgi:hypothetical protein
LCGDHENEKGEKGTDKKAESPTTDSLFPLRKTTRGAGVRDVGLNREKGGLFASKI